jgi:hypothetical protein
MGTCDSLMEAYVGTCSRCKDLYVTSSEIHCDDSHIYLSERYACPSCKVDTPVDITKAVGDSQVFAQKQLHNRLFWRTPYGIEILVSKEH